MKTPIIFLPGKGKIPEDPAFRPFDKIAEYFNGEIIPIVAAHPHRGGFRWHNANKQPDDEAHKEFDESMERIRGAVENILGGRGQNWSDIIWIGHSQGGGMAVHAALRHGAKRVIIFSGDIPDNFALPATPITNFPIDWIQAGHDNVLNPARQKTYKKLQSIGIHVNHITCPDCMHWFVQETGQAVETFDIDTYLKSIDGK